MDIRKELYNLLKPRYERAIESQLTYIIPKAKEYQRLRGELKAIREKNAIMTPDDEVRFKILYKKVFGYYDKAQHKTVEHFEENMAKEDIPALIMSEEEIKRYYTKFYLDKLDKTVESIFNQINKYEPLNVSLNNFTDHDVAFDLELNEGKRTYTINTIIAGGEVQRTHLRTLKKLHKKVL